MSWRAERYHTYTASPNPSQDGRLQLGDLEAAAVALQPPNPSPSPDPNPNPNPNLNLNQARKAKFATPVRSYTSRFARAPVAHVGALWPP